MVLYAAGFGDEERVLVNAGLGRRPLARASVRAGQGRGRPTLLVPVEVLIRREGRGQHLGRDQQRTGDALRSIGPGFGAFSGCGRLRAWAAPLARSLRPIDDVSVLVVHLIRGDPLLQVSSLYFQLLSTMPN